MLIYANRVDFLNASLNTSFPNVTSNDIVYLDNANISKNYRNKGTNAFITGIMRIDQKQLYPETVLDSMMVANTPSGTITYALLRIGLFKRLWINQSKIRHDVIM